MSGKNKTALAVLLAAGFAVVQAQAAQIEVSGVQLHIGGTETDVPGSGTAANYDSGTELGDYAVFDMQKDGSDYADLKVTYTYDKNGSVGSRLMVNQTSDSQGLTDDGTISVLMAGEGIRLKFEWWEAGSFLNGVYQSGSLLSDNVLFTTFDIDHYQYIGAPLDQINYAAFHSNTVLSADFSQTDWILAEDSGASASYDDPETAAQFMMSGGSLELTMGKQSGIGSALFMFEFRDPSTVLPDFVPEVIPEPASMLMIGFVGAASFWVRRRFIS